MKIHITLKRKDDTTKELLKSFGVSDILADNYESVTFELDGKDLDIEKKSKEVTDKIKQILKD